MTGSTLTKNDAFELTGASAFFLRDKVFLSDDVSGKVFYSWRAGDLCHIGGVVERPGEDPFLLLYYGDGLLEIEELGLDEFSTELATADRRHFMVVKECGG